MYAIHTTPGFVIDSRPYGEAGKIYSVFTREFGLIRAAAQGIRLERSKLRYHIAENSLGVFSFVRGKEYWRLTSAEKMGPGAMDARFRGLVARIAQLLRRLLHGEDRHEALFAHIESLSSFIGSAPEMSEDQMKALESVAVLRILQDLGYIGADPALSAYVSGPELTLEILDKASADKKNIYGHINKAFNESQL